MKIAYQPKRFLARSLVLVEAANKIIDEYRAQGYLLTLRQLYYQFVSRDLIPNTQREYNRLGSIVNDARLAGLIDWDAIEDRTRNLHAVPTWETPERILASAAHSYREDLWGTQDNYIEVWIEKEALAGVFQRICDELRVPFFSCRGYVSQSEMWNASQRFESIVRDGRTVTILHFGDHDPSGIDMTRDIESRIRMFLMGDEAEFSLERLALNMDQIRKWDPPPNPAKDTDSRYWDYRQNFGDESWELDALDPKVLSSLVTDAVRERMDSKKWHVAVNKENRNRKVLRQLTDRYDDVAAYLKGKKK